MILRERIVTAFSSSGPYGLGSVRDFLVKNLGSSARRSQVLEIERLHGGDDDERFPQAQPGFAVGAEDVDMGKRELGGLGPGPKKPAVIVGPCQRTARESLACSLGIGDFIVVDLLLGRRLCVSV